MERPILDNSSHEDRDEKNRLQSSSENPGRAGNPLQDSEETVRKPYNTNEGMPDNTNRMSGRMPDGDENYADEEEGKDFDDYNKEYKEELRRRTDE